MFPPLSTFQHSTHNFESQCDVCTGKKTLDEMILAKDKMEKAAAEKKKKDERRRREKREKEKRREKENGERRSSSSKHHSSSSSSSSRRHGSSSSHHKSSSRDKDRHHHKSSSSSSSSRDHKSSSSSRDKDREKDKDRHRHKSSSDSKSKSSSSSSSGSSKDKDKKLHKEKEESSKSPKSGDLEMETKIPPAAVIDQEELDRDKLYSERVAKAERVLSELKEMNRRDAEARQLEELANSVAEEVSDSVTIVKPPASPRTPEYPPLPPPPPKASSSQSATKISSTESTAGKAPTASTSSSSNDEVVSSTVNIKTPEQQDGEMLSKENPVVWKGDINMPDVARFSVTAHAVSGTTDYLNLDLKESLKIVGRIPKETVWDYVAQVKEVNTKEILLIRLQVKVK